MTAATTKAKIPDWLSARNEALRQAFERALARRNFVHAISIAQELNLPEERIRNLQHAAFRQFVMEYQNFDGAVQLIAEYGITAAALDELSAELAQYPELQLRSTLSWQFGQPSYLSVAEQIRRFCQRASQTLQARTSRRHWRKSWQQLKSTIRSWFDDLFTPRRGGFSPGGPAYV